MVKQFEVHNATHGASALIAKVKILLLHSYAHADIIIIPLIIIDGLGFATWFLSLSLSSAI